MRLVQGEFVGYWVAEKSESIPYEGSSNIGWETDEGELVAGILYTNWTGASIAMSGRVDDPSKITREYLFHIFNYPFNQLKVKRVTAMASTGNLRALTVNEKLGWKRETVLKDYFIDGDAVVYVMRKEDCRWLKYKSKEPQCDTTTSQCSQKELLDSEAQSI